MACYRCGARAVDPARGPSPWRRGVRAGAQVLICPECQAGRDWTADLDHCASCDSTALVRRLGEVVCRNCGATAVHAASDTGTPDRDALGEEVSEALDRLFGR